MALTVSDSGRGTVEKNSKRREINIIDKVVLDIHNNNNNSDQRVEYFIVIAKNKPLHTYTLWEVSTIYDIYLPTYFNLYLN